MAIEHFIPEVWSTTLFRELEKKYIAVQNCNRDFEGDIKAYGDTVNINGIGDIGILDYTKNTDMSAPETLTSNTRTLTITQSKSFNFQIDDIDKAQQNPKIMKEAMSKAASALADVADQYIYKLYASSDITAANTVTNAALKADGVIDWLISVREKLTKNNVPQSERIMLEVSPEISSLIIKAKITSATNNDDVLKNGYLGSFMDFDIYVSNNIQAASGAHKCFARTKRAITFAEQINSVEAYRPEKRFADAVKGLHLYGAKIVYPKEILLLNTTISTASA